MRLSLRHLRHRLHRRTLHTTTALSNLTLLRPDLPRFAPGHRPSLPSPKTILFSSMPTIPFLSSWFGTSNKNSESMEFPDKRTDEEWEAVLTQEQFRILRNKGTEPPGSGKYDKHAPSSGVYECAGCGSPLYKATHKFSSGCGWPAYFDSIPGAVTRKEDRSFGMSRTEILCSNCGGHLGHVFKGEGYRTPTDERHCVNSISLRFTEDESKVREGDKKEGENSAVNG
ncbi:methionine-R-sulfoxide reductase [Emergomyces pasteurianus Ep9510]|uniref:Peptide-methionine (R)-S-oxide reductase n=1 Tax=Emergomyces pasteurianus Ep9510 TaxID=1447872 RepID=A0A1J9Q9I2_9EURO|nr:methionine-R-sulfoxide reductase [Emergomyces pasteurianus Ep9510]